MQTVDVRVVTEAYTSVLARSWDMPMAHLALKWVECQTQPRLNFQQELRARDRRTRRNSHSGELGRLLGVAA